MISEGTCDNCKAQGVALTDWIATRPKNWPEKPFMICLRCKTTVMRNIARRQRGGK